MPGDGGDFVITYVMTECRHSWSDADHDEDLSAPYQDNPTCLMCGTARYPFTQEDIHVDGEPHGEDELHSNEEPEKEMRCQHREDSRQCTLAQGHLNQLTQESNHLLECEKHTWSNEEDFRLDSCLVCHMPIREYESEELKPAPHASKVRIAGDSILAPPINIEALFKVPDIKKTVNSGVSKRIIEASEERMLQILFPSLNTSELTHDLVRCKKAYKIVAATFYNIGGYQEEIKGRAG